MRVFHFLNETYALKTICEQRLKVSKFTDLNDPFEMYAPELSSKAHRVLFKGFRKEMSKTTGLLCFSKSWNNPVLWSHYGDRHKGIALEFEVPNEILNDVNYVSQRLLFDPSGLNTEKLSKEDLRKILTTKFEHWKYEQETRIILPSDYYYEEDNLRYLNLDGNSLGIKLKGIIHGTLCQTTEKQIADSLPKGRSISLLKVRLAFRSFTVVQNKSIKLRRIEGKRKVN